MKLTGMRASLYKSLQNVQLSLGALNVLIGANASGKSNILDALRFLSEGLRARDFSESVNSRGGITHLAWKGSPAECFELETLYDDAGRLFSWKVIVRRQQHGFTVAEQVEEREAGEPPSLLLDATNGQTSWWSAQAKGNQVKMSLSPTGCALASACADESFPARRIGEFIQRWGFFDPSPPILRRAAMMTDGDILDPYGRNLAARLYALSEAPDGGKTFQRIVAATQLVLGVPERLEFRTSEVDGRVHFVQHEPGLMYGVHQVGASSGTLRMLALMTALFGETGASLVGIEEPENHVHPSALKAFAEYLRDASHDVQIVVTTHSPLLLDYLPAPEELAVVRRTEAGTVVHREPNPDAIRKALEASGFGLGEFYETKGFGA